MVQTFSRYYQQFPLYTRCHYTSKVGTEHASLNVNPVTYLENFGKNPKEPNMDKVIATSKEYLAEVLKIGTKCTTPQ